MERRRNCKIAYISEQLLVDYLNLHKTNATHINCPIVEGIPEDAEVVKVSPCFERSELAIMLYHPSWPAVPEGGEFESVGYRNIEIMKRKLVPLGDK